MLKRFNLFATSTSCGPTSTQLIASKVKYTAITELNAYGLTRQGALSHFLNRISCCPPWYNFSLSLFIFSICFCLALTISACIALTNDIAAEDDPSGRRPWGGFKCWPAHLTAHVKCFGGGNVVSVWTLDELVCCLFSSEYLGSWIWVRAVTTASSATSSCPTTEGVGTTPLMLSCKDVLLVFWIIRSVHYTERNRCTTWQINQLGQATLNTQANIRHISPFLLR